MGDLICKGVNYIHALHPDLPSIYCGKYNQIGKACGKPDCTKKYVGIGRWQLEHQKKQIAHVESRRDHIMFNTKRACSCLQTRNILLAMAMHLVRLRDWYPFIAPTQEDDYVESHSA